MQKNVLVVIGVGLIVIGAVMFARSQVADDPTNPADTLLENIQEVADSNPLGLDEASLSGPYKIQLVTENDPNGDISAQAEIDSRGNIRTTIQEDGSENMFLYVDNHTYIQLPTDRSWLQVNNADDETSIMPNDLVVGYSTEDIEELSDIRLDGEGNCKLGRCRIYSAKNSVTDESVIVRVEESSNRISDIELTALNGKRTTIEYRYDQGIAAIKAPDTFKVFHASGTGAVAE